MVKKVKGSLTSSNVPDIVDSNLAHQPINAPFGTKAHERQGGLVDQLSQIDQLASLNKKKAYAVRMVGYHSLFCPDSKSLLQYLQKSLTAFK
jgi:hypothetical protein